MKLTVKQLIVGSDALKRLGEKGVKILPYNIFYAVGKNIEKIEKEIDHYNKNYQRIVAEYSAEQPDGTFGVAAKDTRMVNKILEDAHAVEVDIPIMTFALTEEVIEKAEIRAADLATLGWMFVLPQETEISKQK